MCGILLVKSKDSIPLSKHLSAFRKLESRGPDFSRYKHYDKTFIGQTVLHITGNTDYYDCKHANFLAYNGEIYNYRDLGKYNNDIEFVDYAVNNNLNLLQQGWGTWAFAWTDGDTVQYASDPQGEKILYQYQDKNILIVSSEVAPILHYVKCKKQDVPYKNKTWTMLGVTPWENITKLKPGQLYKNGRAISEIDSIWSWIQPESYKNINEAYEHFQSIWQSTIKYMTPNCPAGLTYSGGLDSSVILNSIPNLDLYSVNNVGKDPVVDQVRNFLEGLEQFRLHEIQVDAKLWAHEYQALQDRIKMPALSWSYIGQWIATQACNRRVLFTGCGADELFGGYDVYQTLNYSTNMSTSPYSEHGSPELWRRCLDAYNEDPKQATLLMDYWHQVVGCDTPAVDMISGAFGIEARNPFLARPIMQFALNLPWKYKVSKVTKPLIRRAFLERWPQKMILPKQGFTGHANDSLPYLPVQIKKSQDRMKDWKKIARKMFYESN